MSNSKHQIVYLDSLLWALPPSAIVHEQLVSHFEREQMHFLTNETRYAYCVTEVQEFWILPLCLSFETNFLPLTFLTSFSKSYISFEVMGCCYILHTICSVHWLCQNQMVCFEIIKFSRLKVFILFCYYWHVQLTYTT